MKKKYSQTALQVKSQGSFLLLLVIAFEKKMWYCCRSKGGEIMAKNRTIPFGYCMKNGEITTEPKEVYAVVKIFDEYLKGRSLSEIAKLDRKSVV